VIVACTARQGNIDLWKVRHIRLPVQLAEEHVAHHEGVRAAPQRIGCLSDARAVEDHRVGVPVVLLTGGEAVAGEAAQALGIQGALGLGVPAERWTNTAPLTASGTRWSARMLDYRLEEAIAAEEQQAEIVHRVELEREWKVAQQPGQRHLEKLWRMHPR